MSAVTLLGSGARENRGFGPPVNVSAHALIRLTSTLLANLAKAPQLMIAIDTGPTSQGPWRELFAASYGPAAWPAAGSVLTVLSDGLQEYCRVRWDGHGGSPNFGHVTTSAEFDLTVSGDGKPDA